VCSPLKRLQPQRLNTVSPAGVVFFCFQKKAD